MKIVKTIIEHKEVDVNLLSIVKELFPKVGEHFTIGALVHRLSANINRQFMGKENDPNDFLPAFSKLEHRGELSRALSSLMKAQYDNFCLDIEIDWNEENGCIIEFYRKS